VLAAWRGVDTTPLERAAALTARPLGPLVESAVSRLGLDRRRAEAEIVKVWNSTVDPTLTAHAQPTGLRGGTLFVSVDNSAWLDEIIRYRRKEILDRMQHSFGRDIIARISFRVG
jgi:predicted nucleic acid-binding Zn ribbon protein